MGGPICFMPYFFCRIVRERTGGRKSVYKVLFKIECRGHNHQQPAWDFIRQRERLWRLARHQS